MQSLFGNRDFARLFAGRVVTNIGDSLYFVAAMWLVYDLTGNAAFSGVAGFLVLAPAALQAFAGPLVDRWNLRHVLVGTQLVQGTIILALPVAAHFGHLSVWLVLTVMPLLSLLNQLVYPAQSAALPRIVDDDELVQANSLFSLAYQGVDSVANAAGGVLIAVVGATTLFVVDSVTFAAAALLFATVTIPAADADTGQSAEAGAAAGSEQGEADDAPAGPAVTDGGDPDGDDDSGYLADLREGVAYIRGTLLVPVMLGAAFVNFAAGGSIFAAMPAFADTFGGAGAYGVLMAAVSAGSFVGAFGASRMDDRPFGWTSILAFALGGCFWLLAVAAAASTGNLAVTVCLFALSFVPIGVSNVLLTSMVQSVVPEHLLGRVSGVLGSAASVSIPFGALFGGAITEALGPYVIFAVGGLGLLVLALYWTANAGLRELPAVAAIETFEPAGGQ
ncbi:MFS transporter [Haloarchaeobius sp. HME9146]|uniref:MFS transporter n=1 Tax=Haloarchaeobius sp. HME9146 TaxID=2978732 RepID=UPI0021BECE8D|nr:MFS transporter [Haloarchaeobius sp. HME9146]MCT9095122.1 MFS transporter [Haloarchaeobius sp. HME9146]